MQKETLLVPQLRFPEFDGEWQVKSFDDLLLSSRLGGNYSNSETNNNYPLIKMGNLGRGNIKLNKLEFIDDKEEIKEEDKIKEGDLFFNTRNTLELVGKVAIWRNELPSAYYNSNLMYLKFENNYFMNYCLNSFNSLKKLRRIATGTTSVAAIYSRDLLKVKLSIPSLPEQQKIANFLSAVDTRIQTLDKKKCFLEQYKKGVMQKIFKQEIRFKDDNGNEFSEWETLPLKKVFSRSKDKNKNDEISLVLTNSATQGIVSQNAYFDKDIANSSNLSGYYIVKTDDFIYNPRISQSAPVGPLNRNKLSTGVMSPLYTVLRYSKGNIHFLEIYFKSSLWHRYMKSIANYGARHDRMNVTTTDFENMPIPFPCEEEQQKIAEFLMAIDTQIKTVNQQLEHTRTYKRGLLQQMFV